jgi:hypothetical protein
MAEGFINIEVESDPEVLRQEVYNLIQAQFPEWDPAKAVLDKWIIDGCALIGADLGDVAGVVPKEVLRQFGTTIYEVPALLAEAAVATVTINIQDKAGYPTIKAGTQMMFTLPDGNKVAFRTREDVEVPVGVEKIEGVIIEAVEPGAEANQLAADPEMLDSVSYVTSVTQTSANTSGGIDAETPDEYLDRLTVELELLSTAPITPSDYEKLARRVGMYRAVAIDGWDPETETLENERMVAVAMVDEEGEKATAEKKEEYKAEAESKREVNFIVHTIDPVYNEINVEVEVQALPGFGKEAVKAAIEEALNKYLDPANWANTPSEPRAWRQNTVVRHSELVWLVNTVPGVDFIIDPLKLSKAAGPLKAEDVALEGKAALTKPKTLTVKVVEP